MILLYIMILNMRLVTIETMLMTMMTDISMRTI